MERYMCRMCGFEKIFNKYFNPQKDLHICPRCRAIYPFMKIKENYKDKNKKEKMIYY